VASATSRSASRCSTASKLRTELDKTTKSSDALEVRLTQLYKKFEQLGNAGKAIGQRDIAKALNTQEALKQVQSAGA
jgi:hypothetical protein